MMNDFFIYEIKYKRIKNKEIGYLTFLAAFLATRRSSFLI